MDADATSTKNTLNAPLTNTTAPFTTHSAEIAAIK